MDYTLAMYNAERFESLSASGAVQKLVEKMGYPRALLKMEYDHSFFIRGLVVDKKRGNIIKLDRHKYVKRAMHGFRPMGKAERSEVYDTITASGGGFGEPNFAVLDTIFSLPDAFLFSKVVQYKTDNPDQVPQDFETIYRDVRHSVDLCHRDGHIKDTVSSDPAHFIERDPHMVLMLERLRRSGRKVFLLTNSLFDYTDTVMRFLFAGPNASAEESGRWTDLFDVIITGSGKPGFILDSSRPLYRVDPDTYTLRNTEGVYGESAEEYLERGKCFQGGNYTHLHQLLGVQNGNRVLYVGDHIYSDVLRSKRSLGWRTMLIIPELEREINVLLDAKTSDLAARIEELREKRDMIDEQVDALESAVVDHGQERTGKRGAGWRDNQLISLEAQLYTAKGEQDSVRRLLLEEMERYHTLFHPQWGQLFKTGLQNSRFAEQVEQYACLYTSCVTNLKLVSPEMNWRAMKDLMPHDRMASVPMHRMLAHRREGEEF